MNRLYVLVTLISLTSYCATFADDVKKEAKKDVDLITRLKNAGVADKPFTLVVTIEIKEGTEKAFLAQADKTAKGSMSEKGCITYEFHQDLDNPRKFVLFEKWKNVAALQAHFEEEHTKAILKIMGEVAAAPPGIQIAKPASSGK